MRAQQILQKLDDAGLPMLDGMYDFYARSYLRAFASRTRWLIGFDLFVYAMHADRDFEHVVYAYGNCLRTSGLQGSMPGRLRAPRAAPFEDEETGFPTVDPRRFEVIWKGKRRTFTPSRTDLRKAGVGSNKMPPQGRVVRFLAFQLGDALFRTDREFLRWLRVKVPLQRIYSSSRWRHPVLDGATEEQPSGVPFFQQLAVALATQNPRAVEPVQNSNSDWRDWPSMDICHGWVVGTRD